MGKQFKLDLAPKEDLSFTFDVTNLIYNFIHEDFIYSSSTSRMWQSKFLFLIKNKDDMVVGFIFAVNDSKYGDCVLSLDYCMASPYRTPVYYDELNELLKEAVNTIKSQCEDFIIVHKNQTHIPIQFGNQISDKEYLLDDRVEEFKNRDSIMYKVIASRKSKYSNKKGNKRNKDGNNN